LTPAEQTFPERPPVRRTETAGSVGVRAMVKQFETPILPSPADRKSKTPRTAGRVKVERSLVKKPLLFVANPDK
jgi:hypothetical protein